jgi:hypothetical protein
MAVFKSKEEYEKWKTDRQQQISSAPASGARRPNVREYNPWNPGNIFWIVLGVVFSILGLMTGNIFAPILAVIGVALVFRQSKQKYLATKSERQIFQDKKEIDISKMGEYVYGLSADKSIKDVKCSVIENDFIFYSGDKIKGSLIMEEFGRTHIGTIPRNMINKAYSIDKSQIVSQAFNPLGLVAGSPLLTLLGSSTKHEEHCVVINWDSNEGIENNTVFKFEYKDGAISADNAAKFMMKYSQPKPERLKDNEKKCPHCAEIIKREAKVCRFCSRDV